jgi:hypothetical protein
MADIQRQARLLAAAEPDAAAAFKKFDPAEQRRRFGANDAWMQRWLSEYWLEGMFETAFNAAKGTGKDDQVD